MLRKLARTCYRHRWPVVIIWVVLLAGLLALSQVAGGTFKTEFGALPDTESQAALDILEERGFVERTGQQARIVFVAEPGVRDPDIESVMSTLFNTVDDEIDRASVVSPFEPGGERQIAPDGTIAFAEVNLAERSNEEYVEAGDRIRELGNGIQVPGLTIEYGGDIFFDESEGGGSSEFIGLLGAVVILLIAFGSVLAMGLPIGTALFGVGSGAALIMLATRFMDMPDFTTPAAVMIGIGVGIDYALFIVTRFRTGLQRGQDAESATVLAIDTAGRAVLFAGLTVVISLLGMFAMNLSMINGLAVGASATVLMTMLASVTLLPAALGFVRERIDRLGLPHRNGGGEHRRTIWHRWSRVVQRRPLPVALAGLVFLLVLTVPVASMRLGFGDAGNRPETDTTRRAYDLISDGFGPGFNGPLLVAAEAPNGSVDLDALQDLSNQLNQTGGVAFASPPLPNETGDAAIIQIIPTTAPQDEETEDLVHRLRGGLVDDAVAGSAMDVHVGGITAAAIDFADFTGDRMPIFFAAVLVLSFLLLMLMFRSLLVPLKAVIMNLLSIGAAFGLMIAVFQWGWLADLFGVARTGPIEAWAPMMIFAVVFGLSMDYEVFLLSRIREEYGRTGDNATAVADGLASTARVITAAAAIMIVVFSSFILGEDRDLQLLGFGLAAAVLIDATLVRLVLVPATMELLGNGNWWLPGWLDRILPVVHFEGEPESEPDQRDSATEERVAAGAPGE